MMAPLRRVKLTELNAHLVCVLCSGYFVDATTIIECLHTFCKTCIVRYLQTSSFCPICDVQVHKTKPLLSLREDRTLQDVVFKLVPGLFHSEMNRRFCFYKEHPEAGGDKTEQSLRERRHFFHADDQISLSLEYLPATPSLNHSHLHPHIIKPLKVSNGQQEKQKLTGDKDGVTGGKEEVKKEDGVEEREVNGIKMAHKRYLRCPAAVQVSHLEKFIRLKYSLTPLTHKVDIMHGGDCLVGELTLLDVVYMYKWTEDAPLRLMYTVTAIPQSRKRPRPSGMRAPVTTDPEAPPSKIARTQSSCVQASHLHVSPHMPKGQDASRDQSECSPVTIADSGDIKMEVNKIDEVQPSQYTSNNHKTSVMPTDDSVCSQNLPSTSLVNISCSSTGSAKQLSDSAPTRGRPALTTTTLATATPRVALAHIPSPVNPTSSTSVSVQVSEPIMTSLTITPSVTTTTTSHNSLSIASIGNARMHMSHSTVNNITEAALKPVCASGPYLNKMLQPIIPTRPRLGRPPNSSRITAATMKPPAPRLGSVQNPRLPPPASKKMSPSGVNCRGNQTVSASLNVQSRLSSISGPPVKLGTTKVSVKRSNEVIKDNGQIPSQSDTQVTKPQLSFPTPNISTIKDTQDTQCPPDKKPNLSPKIPSTTSNSPSTTQTVTPTNQVHEEAPPLTTIDTQAIRMTQDTLPVQYTSDIQAVNPSPESTAPQRMHDITVSLPNNQSTQKPGSPTNQQPNTQSNQQSPNTQVNQRPGHQVNRHPPSTQVTQKPPNTQANKRPQNTQTNQRSPNIQANQQPSNIKTSQRPQNSQANQRSPNILANQQPPNTQSSQSSNTQANQKFPNTQDNQQPTNPQANQQPLNIHVNQQSNTQGNQSPNPQVNQQLPNNKANQRSPSAQANQRPPNTHANQRPLNIQASQRPPNTQANQRPANTQTNQRPPNTQTNQRPPNTQTNQRPASTQVNHYPPAQSTQCSGTQSQRPSDTQHLGNEGSKWPTTNTNQQLPGTKSSLHNSGVHVTQQINQQPLGTQTTQSSPSSSTMQRPVNPVHQQVSNASAQRPCTTVHQRSPATSLVQRSTPVSSRPPGSPAPHRPPSSPAPYQPSSPAPHRPPSSPAPHRPPSSPAPHRPPSSPAPHRPSSSPAPHRPPSSPAPHRPPSSPAPHRPPSSPAPHRQPSSPAPHVQPSSPAPHQQPSSPSHQPSSPTSQVPSSSPAPHRQTGSTTPRSHNTLSTPTVAGPTPSRSTPPRITSSTSTVSLTLGNKEASPASSSLASMSHVAGSASTSTSIPSGKSTGSKSGMTFTQARSTHSLNSSNVKTLLSKTQSSSGVKASPKSPGRGRGSSGSQNILSIAQSLASRQLQQRTTASSTSTNTTTTNVAATQVGRHQVFQSTAPNASVYSNAMGGGLVSPALAAFMASAYGDASALNDVTAMRNLITLSQTAACIRDFNLAAMVKAAETLPRPADPTPIDLSPTSKAAPQSPLTNGRAHASTSAAVASSTKTLVSHTSKSPSSKSRRSADASTAPTISPPTPEVTITKLPNNPTSTSNSSTGTGKSNLGSMKLGPTNTNTVSITKRPASNNRIAVAKSPANASVRQIPNPSYLRHHSEARNNVSKSTSQSSVSGSSQNNTSNKAHVSAKPSTSGGRNTGNSPLKETGPLPETSSILKIEHLTRSLAAPASQSYRIFDDR